MSRLLIEGNILVGSWVKFKGTFFGWISNIFNWYFCIRSKKVERWIWGASVGFWNKDKELVREIFEKSITLSKTLQLSRNPDDFWLALFMKQKGLLVVTNKTFITAFTKESSTISSIARNRENTKNAKKMEEYFLLFLKF